VRAARLFWPFGRRAHGSPPRRRSAYWCRLFSLPNTMDDNEDRAMRDRHALDEAAQRRLQQKSAGDSHSPVETYAQHGAASSLIAQPEALVQGYEDGLSEERVAWRAVKLASDAADFSARWEAWRTTVEKRDEATRLLINQSMSSARG
jgi:hypothetical protein